MKSKGKGKYIWYNGVLQWGGIMGLITSSIVQAIQRGFSLENFNNRSFIIKLIIFFTIFSIDGYIYSVISWKKYEEKYGNS